LRWIYEKNSRFRLEKQLFFDSLTKKRLPPACRRQSFFRLSEGRSGPYFPLTLKRITLKPLGLVALPQ
jgi:hypothetical protein